MIEYYLKYAKKNMKSKISNYITELITFFNIENISIVTSDKVYFDNLVLQIDPYLFDELNNLYHAVTLNVEKYEFLQKYLSKKSTNIEHKFRFIDLFAGCGGLSIGLENAGFLPVFVNEIEEDYAETYYFNHNLSLDQYFIGDVSKLLTSLPNFKEDFSNIELVCGGPPCQGFSMANRQRVIDDPRNNLYRSFLEILGVTQPKFFIMENVKGMLGKINEIIEDMEKYLGKEYNISFKVLNAKQFGIPQNRERLFIIGNKIGIDSTIIFQNLEMQHCPKYVLKNAIENLPKLESKTIKNSNGIENDEYGYTLRKFSVDNEYSEYINQGEVTPYVLNHKNRFNNERDIEIYTRLPQGANSLHDSIKDIMPYTTRNHIFKDKYYKLNELQVCKTITSHMKFDCNMYIHPNQSRGLSAREAARIQTFPDDFFFRGSQNKWYAQIGNAVPVKLAELIGLQIIKYL